MVTQNLRDAEDDPADQRPPQRTQAPDDDRLVGEDQPDRTREGVEGGADTDEHSADGGDRQSQSHGHAVEMPVVDTHELGGPLVVGGRAEGASHPRAGQEQLQTEQDEHRGQKSDRAGTSR